MIIALDYDGTYTADPDIWLSFIEKAKSKGHQIFLVTMRYPYENEEVDRQLKGKVDRIIYTSRKGKMRHVKFLGIHVDVWIDDRPDFIFNDSAP